MSLAIVHSRAQIGVEAPAVTVEVHMANGLPSLTLVGLPETAVKESKDRVRSAILNSALQYPSRRITISWKLSGIFSLSQGVRPPLPSMPNEPSRNTLGGYEC